MAVQRRPEAKVAERTYVLEGDMLEACSCAAVCPCWVGEDPDGGACDAIYAYHINSGSIRGVDVAGLTYVQVVRIPGNIFRAGTWRRVNLIDDRATPEQKSALLDAWQGRLGGPLADLNDLVKDDLGVYDVGIDYSLDHADGRIRIGGKLQLSVVPEKSRFGTTTTLRDSIFSTKPGSVAYVGKAPENTVTIPDHGIDWHFENRSAIQGEFRYDF